MSKVELQYDVLIDAREDRCPMPLLKVKLALAKCEFGEVVCLLASDQGSLRDVPHFVSLVGHVLLDQELAEDECRFWIEKR